MTAYDVETLEAGITIRAGAPVQITVLGLKRPFVHLLVQDAHGNPQAGAAVRIYHGGAVVATAKADDAGVVHATGLPPADDYEIEVVGHTAELAGDAPAGDPSEVES